MLGFRTQIILAFSMLWSKRYVELSGTQKAWFPGKDSRSLRTNDGSTSHKAVHYTAGPLVL